MRMCLEVLIVGWVQDDLIRYLDDVQVGDMDDYF